MGTEKPATTKKPTGLANALFTPVQQRVLGLLFGQPDRRFQTAELIRLAESGTGATHRVITRLAEAGLVRLTTTGRQKYYQANPESPVFEELTGLIRKTVGLAAPLGEALAPLGQKIKLAFIYGSVAGGKDRANSDIDLMVIADDLDYPTLFDAVQPAERELGRKVNPTLITPSKWLEKTGRADGFATRVRERPRLFLIGSDDEVR